MLNLDHLISFNNCVVNDDITIGSFNLIEGDWVYLTGNINSTKLLHKVITVQEFIDSGELKVLGFNSEDLIENKIQIRQSISYLPVDIKEPLTEEAIINHISLINDNKDSQSQKVLNELKTELIYGENIIDSNEVKHILMALATKPKILFVDYSFDSYEEKKIVELLDPLHKYLSQSGLAIIFCTNNKYIKTKYISREYKANFAVIEEL